MTVYQLTITRHKKRDPRVAVSEDGKLQMVATIPESLADALARFWVSNDATPAPKTKGTLQMTNCYDCAEVTRGILHTAANHPAPFACLIAILNHTQPNHATH